MNNSNLSTLAPRFAWKGVFPHQMTFTLLLPLRNLLLSPKQLIRRMELKQNPVAPEEGPGRGYSSNRFVGEAPHIHIGGFIF